MDQSPDQQIVLGSASPSVVTTAPSVSPIRRRWDFLVRTARLLLHRLIYLVIVASRPLRPHAPFVAIVAVMLVVIGWMSFLLWGPTVSAQDSRVPMLAPPSSVETYIEGQRTYDAELMWSSLSEEVQASRAEQGASKEVMQTMAEQEQRQGLTYVDYAYVGGVDRESGGGMYVYAVDVEAGERSAKIPMTFFTDENGQVEYVMSPLNQ